MKKSRKKGGIEDFTPEVRELLKGLWKLKRKDPGEDEAWLRGRIWGMEKFNNYNNPYKGTNITIAIGDELISICQPNEKLVIHEFKLTSNTKLGRRVRKMLKGSFPIARKKRQVKKKKR